MTDSEQELSWERKQQIAEEYVNLQLSTMEKHGSLAAVTPAEYRNMVDAAARLVVHEKKP